MLGPVFHRELVATARRGRLYALRAGYAAVLLAALVIAFQHADLSSSIQIAEHGRAAFRNLLLAQGLAVIFLTPALVAGTIAGEVQRKTLGDLLTSDLSATEIVAGKLAARLLHVGVLVTAGVPIVVCAGLLGGYPLALVLLSVAATLSTAYFLGSLAILGSTQTRSVRGAMNFVFTLALTYLILPTAAQMHLPRFGPLGSVFAHGIAPANALLARSTPFTLCLELLRGSAGDATVLTEQVLAMVALQCLFGTLLTALAVLALRPSYRAQVIGRRRRMTSTRGKRARRPREHAPCGDDAMLWKEVLAARTPVLQRPLGLSIVLVLGALLIWGTLEYGLPAFRELWAAGYGIAPAGSARTAFLQYLRTVATGVSLVFLLGVASDAAAGITTEHERDTWISLIATPLTGAEIVRAKLLGAIWGVRHAALVVLLLWLAGAIAGAIHPLGVVLVAIELAAATGFAAALGTWISLRSTDTIRSLARTMACLVLVAGGSLLVTLPALSVRPLALVGCTPVLLAASLASHADVLGVFAGNAPSVAERTIARLWVEHGSEMILASVASALVYTIAARALLASACRGFDARLDRPTVEAADVVHPRRTRARPRSRASAVASARVTSRV